MKNVQLTNVPATIDDVGIAKSATDAKIKLTLDVSHQQHHAEVEKLFPGFVEKTTRMAIEDASGTDEKSKGRPPEMTIVVHMGDEAQTPVFKIDTAVMRQPMLRVSKSAKKIDLVLALVGPVSKAEWAELRESARANVFASVSMVERTVEAKPKKGKGKKTKAVVIVDDGQMSIPGTDQHGWICCEEFGKGEGGHSPKCLASTTTPNPGEVQ